MTTSDPRAVPFLVAYACAHLDELRTLLEETDDAAARLTRLVAALRADPRPPEAELSALVGDLHAAMQAAGDPWGMRPPQQRGSVGAAGVESVAVVYRCPLGVCAGRDADEVDRLPVRCAVTGRDLVRERLG
ncbi:hypothetical protein [Actinomadura verrucosospora]|uniref:Uncharacterized protein n=1 Tax=Actinomadura verrucosospora TaxID=46165 RepID=A0A7D3VVA4_ACTVE|nr:hypothetical protein [Actinomadura verrucosospora]QKG19731.1 hypothetical protein ACTIVE_1367 [Actinomadura verrucosospora]